MFWLFFHDNTHWYIVVLGRRKNQTLSWASFGKLHFLVGFKIPIFWQEIIFKSLAFELKFSKNFNFFYHDITSWYIVVCLKRINWRLYWTSFGKQMYWDLVVFFGLLEKKDLSRHLLNLCNHKSENVPTGLNSKPSKRRTTYPIKGRV